MLLGLLVAVERRSELRLVEPSLLRSRQTVGANVLSLMSTAVMCNVFFFIALYLQLVLGYGILTAGAALLPMTATIVLVAPLAGRLSDRIGRRAPIITGLLLNTARMIGLTLGIATMGAIIASSGNVLAGSPRAREAFVSGLSDALRINAGIALAAAVVAAATITAATRRGQAPPADASLAATAAEPVPAAPSAALGVAMTAPVRHPSADSCRASHLVGSASHGLRLYERQRDGRQSAGAASQRSGSVRRR